MEVTLFYLTSDNDQSGGKSREMLCYVGNIGGNANFAILIDYRVLSFLDYIWPLFIEFSFLCKSFLKETVFTFLKNSKSAFISYKIII